MKLRPYQEQAVQAIYAHIRERDDNPCVVLPTASGKTPCLSTICKDVVTKWNGRVLVLAHVKELLEQAMHKLNLIAPELFLQIGVYSAGLNQRDTDQPIIVAGIQSVYRRARELGAFDLIIVDECHLLPPDGEGRYRTFLKEARAVNPNVRLIGLTATPYRMKTGLLCATDNLLNHICYEVGVKELIVQGYLCPLISKASKTKIDTSRLRVRGGEFIAKETEDLMDTNELVKSACKEIASLAGDRKSVLVFATGVNHGLHIAKILRKTTGQEVGTVFGDTLSFERDGTIQEFKDGKLKYLVNVNVLCVGFDAPNIDCVAMVRPTMSPGLYYQMVGRGFRVHKGKSECLVLDFGGNIMRHGPVDMISVGKLPNGNAAGEPPAKECPECRSVIAIGYSICLDCGFEFPAPEKEHDSKASEAQVLSGKATTATYDVLQITYAVHHKRDAPEDAPRSMRVEYRIGLYLHQSEWICFEHGGYAREMAEIWWRKRSHAQVPDTTAEAVELAQHGALAKTDSIRVRSKTGEKYDRIIGHVLGEKPAWAEPVCDAGDLYQETEPALDWDDVPF